MKRVLIVLAASFALVGCSFTRNAIPEAPIEFARSSYTIVGETSEKVCGSYILGINFAALFSAKTAHVSGGLLSILSIAGEVGSLEEAMALHDSLEKVPTATHLIQPRVSTTISGLAPPFPMAPPIFGQRCSEVRAWAVKVGGPNPQQ